MELGSVTLKTNNQHTLGCVCGSPKRTNSIPAASVVCPTIPPGRANPFFLSCHNKCPLQRGLCACFVVSRITRSPPICAWPGACRAGRARDRGLNCPSWCVEGFRIGVSQGDLSGRGRAVGLQSRPLDLRSRTLCANPVCGSFVSPRPWKTGWEAEERRATLRAGGRKTGTARSVLYLMMQRTSAAAAPASAGDGGGGGQTQLKQAPLPSVVQVLHVIKSDVDNLELRLGIVDGVLERQASASIHLSLKNQVLCEDPCAAVWLPVCSAWSLCGMRCADLALLRRPVAESYTADAKRLACALAWNRVDDTSGKQDPRCQKDQWRCGVGNCNWSRGILELGSLCMLLFSD